MSRYYREENGIAVESDLMSWSEWFSRRESLGTWRVGLDEGAGWSVSTVFLGLDHSFGEGPPLIYETLATSADGDYMRRYSTREQAQAGHEEVVSGLRNGTLELSS